MKSTNIFKLILVLALGLTACAGGDPSSANSNGLTARQTEGKRLFDQYCQSCHATRGETIVTGPSLAAIAETAGDRVEGLSAEEYLLQSIEKPSAYVVDGFDDIMPVSLGQKLDGDQKEAIIDYLLTLR